MLKSVKCNDEETLDDVESPIDHQPSSVLYFCDDVVVRILTSVSSLLTGNSRNFLFLSSNVVLGNTNLRHA